MPKRILNIFISTLLLLVSLALSGEAPDPSLWTEAPVCPDSPFSDCGEDDDYLLKEDKPSLPASAFFLTLVSMSLFRDQGFVKSVFHPPTSVL